MKSTPFAFFIETLERLDRVSSSTEMIGSLADFFAEVSPHEARMAAYLLRGRVAPDYEKIEFGIAESFVIEVLALATSKNRKSVEAAFRTSGDLGDVAALLLENHHGKRLVLKDVFRRLEQIARTSGTGSHQRKIELLGDLLNRCSTREAKFVVRIVLGKLRLGIGEMICLYGLSQSITGAKTSKSVLEDSYNVLSDLGEVAERAMRSGIDSLAKVKPVVGHPIRMMLAQRIRDLADVPAHLSGTVHVEYKYDGVRIQAHLRQGHVVLFSRRLENITEQFPDLANALRAALRVKDAIVEGEIVAMSSHGGIMQDFQVLMQRRRKHGVEAYAKKIPITYFVFDLLFLNGRSLLKVPLAKRKQLLTQILTAGRKVSLATYIVTDDQQKIGRFFTTAIGNGLEGVVIKDAESPYDAGKRGWHWVKYKKEYRAGLADTFDLVVVGAIHGKGARAGSYGSFLVAAFDPHKNKFYSLTKVGTGFTDEELKQLAAKLRKHRRAGKHRLVETNLEADVWFEPAAVMEVTGAQLTVSPVHTVGKAELKKGGLALRFPRFVRWRPDKSPEQATTSDEILDLYQRFHVRQKHNSV